MLPLIREEETQIRLQADDGSAASRYVAGVRSTNQKGELHDNTGGGSHRVHRRSRPG